MRVNEIYVTAFTSDRTTNTDDTLRQLAKRYADEIGIEYGNLDV